MSLRATCRGAKDTLNNAFLHRFFKKRQFLMPDKRSLRKLRDISAEDNLAKSLQHVILAPHRQLVVLQRGLDGWEHVTHLPRDYPPAWCTLSNLSESGAFGEGFGSAGEDRLLLSEIFGNLKNLKTVQLRGWAGLESERDIGMVETFYDHMFAVTLAALLDAEARPEKIEVTFNHIPSSDGRIRSLRDLAFHVPSQLQPQLAVMAPGLKELTLSLYLRTRGGPMFDNAACLERFLTMTPNLVTLQLHFVVSGSGPREYRKNCRNFLTWLGRDPNANLPEPWYHAELVKEGILEPPPAQFPRLQHLELEGLELFPEVLSDLVAKFSPSLRNLSLSYIGLIDAHNEVSDQVNIWIPLLKSFAESPELREWKIKAVNIAKITGWARFFTSWPVVSYQGNDHGLAANKLIEAANNMELDWPSRMSSENLL